MKKLMLDADLRAKLGGATAGVEITDEAGNTVGHFMTHDAFLKLVEMILPWPTKEDLAEARTEMLASGGVGGDELLARLEEVKRRWEARQ